MRLRPLAVLLPALLLALTGCRQPTPTGEEAFDTPPDTATVSDPVYDPEGFAEGWETRARTVILEDETVREAQVVVADDTVRVTAVLAPGPGGELPEGSVLRTKARQFVVAAIREVEPTGPTPGADPLGATAYPYLVSLRSVDGERIFDAIKAQHATDLEEVERGDPSSAGAAGNAPDGGSPASPGAGG